MPLTVKVEGFHARSICLKKGRAQILKDVSLAISPGKCVALVGPNGAGKSSLLKIFSGDLQPQSGAVILDGISMPEWAPGKLARRRAVLPQHSELLFPFSVRDVVLMGRAPYHGSIESAQDEEIAEEAMLATDVQHLQARPYDRLSGGERQRVQLARVLAQVWPGAGEGRGFLLLDEPTSFLDIFHQHVLLETVQRFCQKGIGALVVLHDLNLAMRYADLVMVMYHGHSVAFDVPEKALVPELIREVFQVEAQVVSQPSLPRPILHFQP